MERLLNKGFMKLPDIANIDKRPDDPYTGSTAGVIHVQKFVNLFNYITAGGDWITVLEGFEGHVIQQDLKNMSKSDLADFCRHFILANKGNNKIEWEMVDELLDKLDKMNYVPKWELPSAELYNQLLGEIYTTIINLKIEETITRIFNQIVKGFEELDIYHINLKDRINLKFQVWNYKDLLELYELLHDPHVIEYFNEREVKISLLTNKITRLFISTIENQRTTIYQKVGLAVLFLKEYVKQGGEAFVKAQSLIDLVWKEIDRLSHQEKVSFRTLLGATYSFIIHQISTTQSDFITRRKLLGKLISNFVAPKDFNIARWFGTLVNSRMMPEVIAYILQGYTAFVTTLNNHIMELPDGEIRQELIALSYKIINNLTSTLYGYLESAFKLPRLDDNNSKDFYYEFSQLDLSRPIQTDFQDLMFELTEFQITLGSYIVPIKESQKYINLVCTMFKNENKDVELIIFELRLKLLLNTYPFDEMYEKILAEFREADTIILSTTFENGVINTVSVILDFLLKTKKLDYDYIIHTHEILVVFLGEWLNIFSQDTELYNDAFMLLTPIVSINFIQIIKEYFIKNKVHKAFLTFLNMYYFTEYCVFEIRRSDIWRISDTSSSQKAKISNKFNSIIKEWKIEDFINIETFKKSVTRIEMTIVESGSSSSDIMSGMLEDEIVIGYLNNTEKLERFITLSSDTKNREDNRNLVDDIMILYDKPTYDPVNPFTVIGLSNVENNRMELPFPLIRQIHQYTISMEFFPISTNFIDIIGNKNLFDSITEIMSYMQE